MNIPRYYNRESKAGVIAAGALFAPGIVAQFGDFGEGAIAVALERHCGAAEVVMQEEVKPIGGWIAFDAHGYPDVPCKVVTAEGSTIRGCVMHNRRGERLSEGRQMFAQPLPGCVDAI